jgi:hypothetical protein
MLSPEAMAERVSVERRWKARTFALRCGLQVSERHVPACYGSRTVRGAEGHVPACYGRRTVRGAESHVPACYGSRTVRGAESHVPACYGSRAVRGAEGHVPACYGRRTVRGAERLSRYSAFPLQLETKSGSIRS